MAIMKMKMVNIVGRIEEFDRITLDYVVKSNIHLESVFTVLENVKGMYAFSEETKVSDVQSKAHELLELVKADEEAVRTSEPYTEYVKNAPLNIGCILNGLETVKTSIISLEDERNKCLAKLNEYDELRKQLRPIESADIDLNRLYEFEFIKFRFGKMPVKSYRIIHDYLKGMDTFFLKTSEDSEYIWGIYFMPEPEEEKVDAVFSTLYFERLMISNNVHGTPRESLDYLDKREQYRRNRINELEQEIKTLLEEEVNFIVYACDYSREMIKLQEVKRYSGHTKESFYIVGWMTDKEADGLEADMSGEETVIFLKEKPEDVSRVNPPTRLKNLFVFRPFEMFIRMYGLPSYKEFDPTWIFALSYFIMFGAMFGDLGQGFLLFIGGFLLAKVRKSNLGAVIGTVGISSMIFGIVYGSIFGDEEIIKGYNPMEHIMDVLFYAVYLGVGIIFMVMLINIILGIKNKNKRRLFLSQNGIAGLVLYATAVITVLSMLKSSGSISSTAIVAIVIALILIMFQEPLAHLLDRKRNWLPKKKGMFVLESFFEMFEICLSFVTNTLSFLRVGAFALIHVGMMGVVKILAEMIGSGSQNIVVLVFGNLLVMGLEGLVVGIQVLRIGFYEMFSRFYTGDGKEFKPINEKI